MCGNETRPCPTGTPTEDGRVTTITVSDMHMTRYDVRSGTRAEDVTSTLVLLRVKGLDSGGWTWRTQGLAPKE